MKSYDYMELRARSFFTSNDTDLTKILADLTLVVQDSPARGQYTMVIGPAYVLPMNLEGHIVYAKFQRFVDGVPDGEVEMVSRQITREDSAYTIEFIEAGLETYRRDPPRANRKLNLEYVDGKWVEH